MSSEESKVGLFHRMLFRWHCRNFYPFKKRMTSTERRYLKVCFELFDDFQEVSETGFKKFSSFSYSHRVQGEQVNSSRIAYGSVENPEAAQEAAAPVLKERGIVLPSDVVDSENARFGGLGWDIEENQFKVYFRWLGLGALPGELTDLVKDINLEEHRQGCLISYTFLDDTLEESKVYLYPQVERELPEGVANETWMVTSKRGLVHQYDLYYPSNWGARLNKTGRDIVAKYRTRQQTLDTINYTDENDFTLYFP